MGELSWRDAWLLPLISVTTVLCMLGGGEVLARVVWPERMQNTCMMHDLALGYRYRPNCLSTMKLAEGPWYTNSYNTCGYRSVTPCGPVPAGTRRIALLGASVSDGYGVEYSNTIGAQLGADLTAACDWPVEVQNLAVGTGLHQYHRLVLRAEEALTLQPSAMLLVEVPYDIELLLDDAAEPIAIASSAAQHAVNTQPPSIRNPDLLGYVSHWLRGSRALSVAQHFLLSDRSIYLPIYLHYGDKADFLRPPFTAAWQERLRRFDLLITDLADRARQTGVPFMLVFVPHQAELALMSSSPALSGVDPQALPNAIAAIAARHGVTFVDTSQVLRAQRQPDQLYYRVDSHLSGRGHRIVARYIAQRYLSAANGPFKDCRSKVATP